MSCVQLPTDTQMGAPVRGHLVGKKRKDLPSRSSEGTWHPDLSPGTQVDGPEEHAGRRIKECITQGPGSLAVGPLGSPGNMRTLLLFIGTDQPS